MGHSGDVALAPVSQYATDANLCARQRLWRCQDPTFDLAGWAVGLARLWPGAQVLDVGCGNGTYLSVLAARQVRAVGVDLSLGMLRVAGHAAVVNADAVALPFADGAFDAVLAPHMLYHVADRSAAVHELRRVLTPGGSLVAVTNGAAHTATLRSLVEEIIAATNPGWRMLDWATQSFSLENGAAQLGTAFASVSCVRPAESGPVVVRDAAVIADYVASVADHYQDQVDRPWSEVVAEVRRKAQAVIDRDGAFIVTGDVGAFVCR
ncbi:MAG: class I SAM-dependent methyltransferase [Mycobacteriales bacterium]